jgi:hypothetical protein
LCIMSNKLEFHDKWKINVIPAFNTIKMKVQ